MSSALPPEEAPAAATEAITRLLHAIAAGEAQAQHELLPLVYEHLRCVAQAQLARERIDCSINATSLVHEAYLRIMGGASVAWVDREHFFNTAARAMRFVLVDRARAILAGSGEGRGGPRRPTALPRDIVDQALHATPEEIASLDLALAEFERLDPRATQVVVWRFYNGMTIEQVADVLECGIQTVNRDWRRARAWLADFLTHDSVGGSRS